MTSQFQVVSDGDTSICLLRSDVRIYICELAIQVGQNGSLYKMPNLKAIEFGTCIAKFITEGVTGEVDQSVFEWAAFRSSPLLQLQEYFDASGEQCFILHKVDVVPERQIH